MFSLLLALSSSAFAANPMTFEGTCPDFISPFSFTVDFDTATVVSDSGTSAVYTLTPTPTDWCGISTDLSELTVIDGGATCGGPSDALAISGSAHNMLVMLFDGTGAVFDSTLPPTSLDVDDFDFHFTRSSYDCGPGGSIFSITSGVLEELTLLERANEARTFGENAYIGLYGESPKLATASVMESVLATPLGLLEAASCEIDTHLGGAYGPALAGDDAGGPVAGLVLDTGARTWSGVLSDANGFDGTYSNQRQLVAVRDDDGFVVGNFVRTKGRTGTFYGVSGTCPSPIDYEAVLGGWFQG